MTLPGMTGGRSATNPSDSRLGLWLVRPLRNTRVYPDHVTTPSVLTGLSAGALDLVLASR